MAQRTGVSEKWPDALKRWLLQGRKTTPAIATVVKDAFNILSVASHLKKPLTRIFTPSDLGTEPAQAGPEVSLGNIFSVFFQLPTHIYFVWIYDNALPTPT